MKVLFMGTPDFAAGILRAICENSSHEVVAVVTQPDRPKGRKGDPVPGPVKVYAAERGIKVLQPEKIKTEDEVEKLMAIDADIYVVAAFGQILSRQILDIPRYGCINVHASLLPEYRGAAPIQWAIADGKEYTGVTIQQMNEGVDTGDIISSSKVDIDDDETGETLFDKLMCEGAKLIVRTLDEIEAGTAKHLIQDEAKATYAKILKKEMGLIDFDMSAAQIERRIRAFTPWPGGYTYLGGRMIKIKKCALCPDDITDTPGRIVRVTKDEMVVACGSGALSITVIQPEGKKEMQVHDFLLGNHVSSGDTLGGTRQ